ncbi:MAG: hypothetical protein M3303_05450, partial [Gemmatimonadota bacterium]|nr:hypothetical protein [Gemmatimonadota bacterium]
MRLRRPAAFAAFLLLAPTPALAQRAETGFLDRTVTLRGTTHRYQVYVPAAYAGSTQRWPVILFLHGGGVPLDDHAVEPCDVECRDDVAREIRVRRESRS